MLFSTLVLAISAAEQLSVGRSNTSALLENGLIRAPEDRMVMLDPRCLGWIGGVHLSTSVLSKLFRGLFCLPREWVDPLTDGNVYLVEFISSLGW